MFLYPNFKSGIEDVLICLKILVCFFRTKKSWARIWSRRFTSSLLQFDTLRDISVVDDCDTDLSPKISSSLWILTALWTVYLLQDEILSW